MKTQENLATEILRSALRRQRALLMALLVSMITNAVLVAVLLTR